jgi:hypothetical protein
MRSRILFLMVFFTLSAVARAEIPGPPLLLLTAQDNGTDPQDAFACSGIIHGYLTFPKTVVGKHVLEAIWTGPHGKVVQHSRDEINYAPPGHRTATIWLKFSQEDGGIWNPFAIQKPTDLDHAAYDGPWTLEVRWDEKPFTQSAFQVHCL